MWKLQRCPTSCDRGYSISEASTSATVFPTLLKEECKLSNSRFEESPSPWRESSTPEVFRPSETMPRRNPHSTEEKHYFLVGKDDQAFRNALHDRGLGGSVPTLVTPAPVTPWCFPLVQKICCTPLINTTVLCVLFVSTIMPEGTDSGTEPTKTVLRQSWCYISIKGTIKILLWLSWKITW